MSLRIRTFLVISIILVLSIGFLAGILSYQLQKNAHEQASRIMEENNQYAALTINQWLIDRENLLKAVAVGIETEQLTPENPKLLEYLRSMVGRFSQEFHYLYTGWDDKNLVTDRDANAPQGFDPTIRPWFLPVKKFDTFNVTEPYLDIVNGKINVTLSVPIHSSRFGVLAADYFLTDMTYFGEKVLYEQQVKYILLSSSGKLVYSTDSEDQKNIGTNLLSETQGQEMNNLLANMYALKDGSGEVTWSGKRYYVVHNVIPASGWVLASFLPEETFTEQRNKIIANSLVVAILAMAFAFLGAYLLIRRLTRPLELLAYQARRVGEGDMEAQFPIFTDKEIGSLAKCLEYMRQSILSQLMESKAQTEEIQSLYQQVTATEEELRAQFDEMTVTSEKLSLSEERLRLAIDSSEQGIWDVDISTRKYMISQHWAEKLGVSSSGADWDEFLKKSHPEYEGIRNDRIQAHLRGETPFYEMEYRLCDVSGKWIWVLSKGKAIFDKNNEPIRFIGSFTDITEIREQVIQKEYEANHDELTGLLNRRGFIHAVNSQLKNCTRSGQIAYVAMLDIDDFKVVNETSGHSAGDDVLKQFSLKVDKTLGDSCIFARLSGDEFIVFFWGESEEGLAIKKTIESIDSYFVETVYGSKNYSVSRGLAIFPYHGSTIEELLRKADIALHEAKRRGKNQCGEYDQNLETKVLRVAKIRECIAAALANQEFWLAYQPIYRMKGKKPVGFEALLRWDSPALGSISPDEFIPIAEEMGTIIPIGEWVLQEACRFARKVYDKTGRYLIVGINVSARQLLDSQFNKMVERNVREFCLPAGKLVIEVTETSFMANINECSMWLNDLREKLGVQIALDDFGTGYSSLTQLKNLPLDLVKADKKFIDSLIDTGDVKGHKLIRTIIQMAKDLGFAFVAEGIEFQEQFDYLFSNGCGFCQGYLLNRPLKEETAIELVCFSITSDQKI